MVSRRGRKAGARMTRVIIPARRDRDAYGRRIDRCGQAPHMVLGGFKIATDTWTRTEDGWDCDYDFISHEVYPTADLCWAAINGDAPAHGVAA